MHTYMHTATHIHSRTTSKGTVDDVLRAWSAVWSKHTGTGRGPHEQGGREGEWVGGRKGGKEGEWVGGRKEGMEGVGRLWTETQAAVRGVMHR